jgi:putative oxidoreductase
MVPQRYAPQLYALMRIVFGFLYLVHALQKLFGMFGGRVVPIPSLFGIAGAIELVAGILIIFGLFTRVAAFVASGEMAAAYFIAHFPRSFWPVQNGGEPAVLFCFAFLYIATRGAGPWSIDSRR